MGLAAPRKRTKISHDPNNTRWASNDSSFGLKIMTAQGWSPGEYLGASNAPHAELHTAASASYIRVAVREENLGLGAKTGGGGVAGICTGLDAFKDILGRLNGKEEEIIRQEREGREESRRRLALEGRWGQGAEGVVKFVKGGWLVGDKIEALIEAEKKRIGMLDEEASTSSHSSSDEDEGEEKPERNARELVQSRKKRKRDEDGDAVEANIAATVKSSKSTPKSPGVEEAIPEVVAVKSAKPKKRQKSGTSKGIDEKVVAGLKKIKFEKDKKNSKKYKNSTEDEEATAEGSSIADSMKKSKKSKKEKKSKTETEDEIPAEGSDSKRRKKDKKQKKRLKDSETVSSTPLSVSSGVPTRESTIFPTPATATNSSGASTPLLAQGRHAVRSRNIAQKRLACLDTTALNQIFMIKP